MLPDPKFQVLDDGRLTDNKGVTVDFTNTIIILTSNIGSSKIISIDDKEERRKAVLNELKLSFKPEFLNRLDDIIIFEQLGIEAIISIVDIMFANIEKKLQGKHIQLKLSRKAKEFIANSGFDNTYGARPLQRALYEIVEDNLATLILEDKVNEGDVVSFDMGNDGHISIDIKAT